MGSTDSRPDGDNADSPLDELKCILERRVRGPPKVRPGMRRTPPPCRMAEGSSYSLKVKATKTKFDSSQFIISYLYPKKSPNLTLIINYS